MSEELMLLTNGTEKESPKPNHYVDDPSFIREEETPEAREKQFKEMQRSMRPGYKPPDKVLIAIAALLTKERPLWIGTADALVHESGVSMKPNALSRYLGSHVTELKKDYFIEFVTGRTHEGRSVKLYYEPPVEELSEKEDEKHGNTMV